MSNDSDNASNDDDGDDCDEAWVETVCCFCSSCFEVRIDEFDRLLKKPSCRDCLFRRQLNRNIALALRGQLPQSRALGIINITTINH